MPPFDAAALQRLRIELARHVAIAIEPGEHRRAAVLAPLIVGNGGDGDWKLLFTQRGEHLSSHGGQISFPGGTSEPGEALEDAALRELEEEVGIPRGEVELIGRLDDLVTNSGFLVAPFVGIIPANLEYVPQEGEVTGIFDVSIATLLRADNPEIRSVQFRGRDFPSYFYHHDGPDIWGLTARMVKSLLDFVLLAR